MDMLLSIVENIWSIVGAQLPWMIGLGIAFAVMSLFVSHACNPGKVWWQSKDLATDIVYCFAIDVMAPYIKFAAVIIVMLLLHGKVNPDDIAAFFKEGEGLFSASPLWVQVAVYMLGTDVLLYWCHRFFHGRRLWPFHAVHHAPEDLDWTAMYRIHPVNRLFGSTMVHLVMIGIGIPPWIMVALVPFDIITAAWVHSNLNWTLGPLKYLIATPVFHRWHHTGVDEGGEKNFSSTFAIWDLMFGTFYMPEGKLPSTYGVDDPNFPKDFIGQMLVPFKMFYRSFRPENPPTGEALPSIAKE
jgi:sterol desaturase/sphingolipid hydroxylase (fatty acid hydroxylase superfamily)